MLRCNLDICQRLLTLASLIYNLFKTTSSFTINCTEWLLLGVITSGTFWCSQVVVINIINTCSKTECDSVKTIECVLYTYL